MFSTRPQSALAVLLIAGAAVIALAVYDVGPFSNPPTREDQVQETVERFFGAAGEGDFATFCGLLTAEA